MNDFACGLLKIASSTAGGKLTLTFLGKSSTREPATTLVPFFNNILKNPPTEIILAFDKLIFMNSSTVPPLAQFIDRLEKQAIRTSIVYDPKASWQQTTFGVLRKIADHYRNITFIAKDTA